MNLDENQRTLISYSHDSPAHKERVRELADRLNDDGVDCHLDRYLDSPPEGWTRWMMNQIEESAFVLVVCTETYDRRFRGKEDLDKGFGVTWEGFIITNEIYRNASRNTKFIPVVFSTADAKHIPSILRDATFYRLDTEEGYEDLYRRLTAQPGIVKPPVGARRKLPPRNLQNPLKPAEHVPNERSGEVAASQLPAPTSARPQTDPLVYLQPPNANGIFIPASRIEHKENLALVLKPDDARSSAFLTDLRRRTRNNIAVAYGDEAVVATVGTVSRIMEAAGETWSVVLELPDSRYRALPVEATINGVTPDEIAEFRVRRLLLDEKLSPREFGRDRLTIGLIEGRIAQTGGIIRLERSPLPDLYQNTKNDVPLFLAAARLLIVMVLKTSYTVEHILKLDLHMQGEDELVVNFWGQRPQPYQNAEPPIIKVDGVCHLANVKESADKS